MTGRRKSYSTRMAIEALLIALTVIISCRSQHVDITVENHTGAPIQLLEVDYPNASFGADALAAGADFHYRVQVVGSGQIKIQYNTSANQPIKITGPSLAQKEQGRLQIVLQPNGKANFHPELTPAN